MDTALLVLHVLTAIVSLGALTMSMSAFERTVEAAGDGHGDSAARLLMRNTRMYSFLLIPVAVLGLAVGALRGLLGEPWLLSALVLLSAVLVLVRVVVLPAQAAALAALPSAGPAKDQGPRPLPPELRRRLALGTAGANFGWVAVLVLMIVKPG